jgi:hypothetical protein
MTGKKIRQWGRLPDFAFRNQKETSVRRDPILNGFCLSKGITHLKFR